MLASRRRLDQTQEELQQLRELVARHGAQLHLRHLVQAGLDRLPLPGSGQTLARWRMLSEVAALDLSLAKLFEGHADAQAIMAELGAGVAEAPALWGTWCAEPPDARLEIRILDGDRVRLSGRKCWCSGAAELSHALVSGWADDGRPWLAAVSLQQPGVHITQEGWPAVGMAASRSVDVLFEGADARVIGAPGDYLQRPGFWQGGAGIAACWYGGATGIAREVAQRCTQASDPHRMAHLGAIEAALAASSALLRQTADWIDAHPRENAQGAAATARLAVEEAAQTVLIHAGRALGAGPLCRDARLGRAMADLPIYLRQSHAERDQEAVARMLIDQAQSRPVQGAAWML